MGRSAPLPCATRHRRKDERVASREDVGPILNGIPTHLPDIDPAETAGVARQPRRGHRRPRPDAGPLPHAAHARARPGRAGGRPVADDDRLRQHDQPRAGALVPRRRGGRAALPRLPALERRDDRAPRPAPRHRRRRPHLDLRLGRDPLRGRLQPLLPRQGPPRRWRPGLLPGPRLPRHVRPRVPRGAAVRGPPRRLPPGEVARRRRLAAGLPVLPAPAPDAATSGSSRRCRWASAR